MIWSNTSRNRRKYSMKFQKRKKIIRNGQIMNENFIQIALISWDRPTTKLVVINVEKSIEEHVLHLSIDAMQNKLYPSFGHYKEPAIYYFTKKITLHLLGVVDERLNKGTVYLYDQRIGPTNSNHTISVLYQALKTFRKTQQVLWINMDNCAVNKNRFVSTSILCSCIDQLRKN